MQGERNSMFRWIKRAILFLAAIAGLLVPTTALASGDSMVIQPRGTLLTRVDLQVTVQFTCPSGDTILMNSVNIEQAAGNAIATGGGGFGGPCSGNLQTVVVDVLAN